MSTPRRLYTALPFLLFAIVASVLLLVCYPDMLYTAQDRNEFFANSTYFEQFLHKPFGMMNYVGSYLTQFFYHPIVGVALLLAIWAGIYSLTLSVTGLTNMKRSIRQRMKPSEGMPWLALLPLTCLLCSLTDVGYWVYVMPIRGYWFAESLSLLLILLMLRGAQLTPRRWRAQWYVYGALTFPILGMQNLFFCLCLLMMQIAAPVEDRTHKRYQFGGLGAFIIGMVILIPLQYDNLNNHQLLESGLPIFETDTMSAMRPTTPFLILAMTMLLLFLTRHWRVQLLLRHVKVWMYGAVAVVFMAVMLLLFSYRDSNYQREMRMTHAAMADDWSAVLDETADAKSKTPSMVMLQNIALMNTGQLGNSAFYRGQESVPINNPDSININELQIVCPLVYYNYGKMQFATRWCMENAVRQGFSPFLLKIFVRVAQETGEQELKDKYMRLLAQTTFHNDWKPKPTSEKVHELNESFSDVIDSDDDDCEKYLKENFSMAFGSSSLLVRELNLFYAMLSRNPQVFWNAFHAYASLTEGKNLPIHYQEAYVMMAQQAPATLPYTVEVTPALQDNYLRFCKEGGQYSQQGKTQEEMRELMRPNWHQTYWWHLAFVEK